MISQSYIGLEVFLGRHSDFLVKFSRGDFGFESVEWIKHHFQMCLIYFQKKTLHRIFMTPLMQQKKSHIARRHERAHGQRIESIDGLQIELLRLRGQDVDGIQCRMEDEVMTVGVLGGSI